MKEISLLINDNVLIAVSSCVRFKMFVFSRKNAGKLCSSPYILTVADYGNSKVKKSAEDCIFLLCLYGFSVFVESPLMNGRHLLALLIS